VTGDCRLPVFEGWPVSREPYIAGGSACAWTLRRHRVGLRLVFFCYSDSLSGRG